MFYFTPLQGFFSPFPHGTRSLSVITAYLALEDGPPGFRQGFSRPALLTNKTGSSIEFTYETITLFGAAFQPTSASDRIGNCRLDNQIEDACRTTPRTQRLIACTHLV